MKYSPQKWSVDDPSFRPPEPGDEELMKREGLADRQNTDMFEHSWANVQSPVRAFLTSFLSDRSIVDDCVQEVALLAWKKGPVNEGPERLLTFSLACAKRVAFAEIRRSYRNRRRLLAVETLTALAEQVAEQEREEMARNRTLMTALRGCLDELAPEPRRLLELRYVSKDRSAITKEAKSHGYTVDAIYKKLERIRGLLRDCVTRKMKEEA